MYMNIYIYIYIYIYLCEPVHIHARSNAEQREVGQRSGSPRPATETGDFKQ